MTNVSEEIKLVEGAKQDIKAFDALYELYLPKILNYCLNRTSNLVVAEDITSQVFLKVIESLHRFDANKGYGFGPWIYRIAHNELIDYFRKNKNKTAALEETDTSYTQDFDRPIEISEKQIQISKILSKMNERYQEVITLKFFADLSNEEIANLWKVKPTNVALVLHRALKDFRSKYKKAFPEGEMFDINFRTT